MAKKEQIIRTSFSDIQWEDVVFLMKELRADTAHELMRALVRDAARELRAHNLRYGPSTVVPRESKNDRRNKLEEMSDEDLTAELNALGALETYKNRAEDVVFITKDSLGRRIMRVDGPNGGGDTPLSMFLNLLAKQKVI